MAGAVNSQLPLPQPGGTDGPSIFAALVGWSSSLVQQLFAYGNRINICLPKDGSEALTGPLADAAYSYQTPLTGFSITVAAGVSRLILDPAGTLATGTITMPAKPIDGQTVYVSSTQTITALTVSPNTGQTIKNAPTTLSAGTGFGYLYRAGNTTWYRIF